MKQFYGKESERVLIGKEGVGPAGYLPPRHTLPDGRLVEDAKDPAIEVKYESVPSFSIGKQPRNIGETINYEYMKNQDDLDLDKADLKRKHSSPSILIGTSRRV